MFIAASCTSSAQTIGGIGAQLLIDTSGGFTMPRVQSLVDNSPAAQKLKATDFIISVNGVSCKDKTIEEVVAMIRGIAGTTVTVVVADTKQGARPREYALTRVAIQIGNDPVPGFNTWAEGQVKQLKNKGFEIVRTFTSDCGNYFFNFDAEAGGYRILLYAAEVKGTTSTPGYVATANVSDGGTETTALTALPATEAGQMMITQLGGTVTFKRDCVATIATTIKDDAKKCTAMYVVVYR